MALKLKKANELKLNSRIFIVKPEYMWNNILSLHIFVKYYIPLYESYLIDISKANKSDFVQNHYFIFCTTLLGQLEKFSTHFWEALLYNYFFTAPKVCMKYLKIWKKLHFMLLFLILIDATIIMLNVQILTWIQYQLISVNIRDIGKNALI